MTINDLIDQFVETKAKREALSDEVKQLTSKLGELEKDIMELMSQAGISQAGNDKASCFMKQARHPAIDDWKDFYAYVAKTGQFELLQIGRAHV